MSLFSNVCPAPFAPLGARWKGLNLQFSLYASDAEMVEYCFYENPHRLKLGQTVPVYETITLLKEEYRFGNLWNWEAQLVQEYSSDVSWGMLIRVWKFDPYTEKLQYHWVLDPCTKETAGGENWGDAQGFQIDPERLEICRIHRRGVPTRDQVRRLPVLRPSVTDRERPPRPQHSLETSVVYECHVRGMTQSASAPIIHSKYSGTYRGLTECIPYLQELGVTMVELLPVYDFDENENHFRSPTDTPLYNYWGYSPLLFFAPKQNYAYDRENAVQEFKEMVDAFHAADIEIILDVVYNHTAEHGEGGPIDHFKWLGQKTWYLHDQYNHLANYSGCGNALNCSHPAVKQLLRESLYYWSQEIGVDGFRFDLASILSRSHQGDFHPFPYLLWEIRHDPALAGIKFIAEPWDAAGGYHLGYIAGNADWMEWNDRYRDSMRKAIRGDMGVIGEIKQSLLGSPDVYLSIDKGRRSSINFITAHDGMTMWDLVSYNNKHNEMNGEENRDGSNNNNSYNCGEEGPTQSLEITALRRKKVQALHLLLQLSNGVPMILAGDEFGRTQHGNNNAYCLDNNISWVNWNLLQENNQLFLFVKAAVAFRKKYFAFLFSDRSQYEWLNCFGGPEDLSGYVRTLVWKIVNPDFPGCSICILFNFYDQPLKFHLPSEAPWRCVLNTALETLPTKKRRANKQVLVEGFSIQVLQQGPAIHTKRR